MRIGAEAESLSRAPAPACLVPLNLESRLFGLGGTHSEISLGREQALSSNTKVARARMVRWGPSLGLRMGRGWGAEWHRSSLPCPCHPRPHALAACSSGALPELL